MRQVLRPHRPLDSARNPSARAVGHYRGEVKAVRTPLHALPIIIAAAILADCASSHPAAAGPSPKASEPSGPASTAGPHSSSVAIVSPSIEAAIERRFAYWLAASAPQYSPQVARLISGPFMRAWSLTWALTADADAANGNPDEANSVTRVKGGYRLCGQDSSGSRFCNTFTGFQFNSAGRITGFLANGEHPRGISAAPPSAGTQLALSKVVAAYYLANGVVVVDFQVRNITTHVVGSVNPAFLAVLDVAGGGQYTENDSSSSLPGPLQPGESAVAYAAFATHATTGEFSLRSNDQIMTVLASTTLRAVEGS